MALAPIQIIVALVNNTLIPLLPSSPSSTQTFQYTHPLLKPFRPLLTASDNMALAPVQIITITLAIQIHSSSPTNTLILFSSNPR